MARRRKDWRWLRGYVTSHATDWDPRVQRWRVEIRFEGGRVMWSWPATDEGVTEQAAEAERWRRPEARY